MKNKSKEKEVKNRSRAKFYFSAVVSWPAFASQVTHLQVGGIGIITLLELLYTVCAIADANIPTGGRRNFNFAGAYCDIVTQDVLRPLDTAYLNLNCTPSCRFIAFTVCNMHIRSSCAASGALVCRNLPKKTKQERNAGIRQVPELAETIGPKHLSYCLALGNYLKCARQAREITAL